MMQTFATKDFDENASRVQRSAHNHGPSSEHGKLCKAPYRPNLLDPLERCTAIQGSNHNGCAETGFSCQDGYCCPDKASVCSSPVDSGHENEPDEHFGRYAYDESLKACIKFSYFGNAGNYNNFIKHNECIRFCSS
ncbi:kunitz/Bovine pancreatic trypsin inhibitor domain-containing protein [Ditylenchus destructor]|uniref:Kunitz/Bovine pancreatic trypsin inhibitor domain-containing protein n=1 Tax=Ditylenchus destructor TaxID=166010 RepID=A0AAD4NAU9_9BILA|nr:kunitz/Bovine pancreatic trypsin inhibitor domain-containing protein [Ditylenchus destructor]